MSEEKAMPNYMKFVLGGAAGMTGTLFVQPLDVLKTRMQVLTEKKRVSTLAGEIVKNEGVMALYKGIGAGLMRQATYTTARLGIYTNLTNWYQEKYKTNKPSVIPSIIMGLTAGACGAYVGTPAEVVLIRMSADGNLPPSERRNYKNFVSAFYQIATQEGVPALWRGSLATVGRAMVVNATQLASYSQFKSYFQHTLKMDGIGLHFSASMLSGFLTTITSLPLDIAKTRIQNQKIVDGKREYNNVVDVFVKVANKEGSLALWKGFIPYFCRIGPHTVLTLIFLEYYTKMYYKHVLGTEGSTGI